MSILEKYNKAMDNKDEAAMNEILDDDYNFVMHKSGNVLEKKISDALFLSKIFLYVK